MDLKSLTKKFINKTNTFKKSSWTINPDLYWKSILLLSGFMLAGFFIFGFLMVKKVNDDTNIEDTVNVVKIEAINKERLNNIIEYFSKREEVSNTIINLPSPVVDPSL